MTGSRLRQTPFEQDLAKRIAQAGGSLTTNDQRIVKFIHKDVNGLAFHTSESFAKSAGVSRAAVIRLAQKLGYNGFAQLRSVAQDDFQSRHQTLTTRFSTSRRASLLDKKIQQDVDNLYVTQELVKDSLHNAATRISLAPNVYIVGNRETYGLSVFLHRMLHTVRSNVRLVDPGFPDEISRVRPDDIVVACLFRRYSKLTVSLLSAAKASGTQTLLITDGGANEFSEYVDHVLITATESPSLYWSMVAPVSVLESLTAEIAAIDPKAASLALQTTEQFTRDQRIFWETNHDPS